MGDAALVCHPVWYARDRALVSFREATRALEPLAPHLPPSLAASQARVVIIDVEADPSFVRAAAAAASSLTTGVLIPVRISGEVVAVFEFFSRSRVGPDSPAVGAAVDALGALGHVFDRRRLDETARVLDQLSQQSAEALAIIRADEKKTFSYVNHAMTRLLGRDASEILGKPTAEVFAAALPTADFAVVAARLRSHDTYHGEVTVIRRDGRSSACELFVTPITTAGPYPTHYATVLRDVTEARRRDAERVLLRRSIMLSARQWRQTFDAIESPVVIVDAAGTIHRLNRRATEMSGRSYSRNIGSTISGFGGGEPWLTSDLLLRHVVETGEGAQDQVVDDESGRSWDVSVTPLGTFADVAGIDKERFLVLAQDVSHLVELRHSLRRHETMAAMGEIVAGVAHEVRNPLFGLSATLDAFENRFGSTPDHEPYLRVLRSSVDRIAALMRDLLDYGRPPTPDIEQGDFEATLFDSAAACSALASSKRVTLAVEIGTIPRRVMIDKSRIERVLTNVIENGIQHAPEGSTVTASAMTSECGRWLRCRIRDEGPGFAPGDLPHLFSPFFTRRPGGTGLGLAIVQRILEQHGGHVIAANDPAGGAVVTIQLPIDREPNE